MASKFVALVATVLVSTACVVGAVGPAATNGSTSAISARVA